MPDRAALYDKIETRFDAMIKQGALLEIEALKDRRLNATLPAMKAIGVNWLIKHLNNEISLSEAMTLAKRDTRRLAKRQFTWFRSHSSRWKRYSEIPAKFV